MPDPPTDPPLAEAVVASLKAIPRKDVDAAAARLAHAYAAAIDAADDKADALAALGPKLLAALDALGMTPKSRSAIVQGEVHDKPSPRAASISKLRARQEARAHRA